MLTDNQINQYVKEATQRDATPYELKKYSTASIQELANLKDYYLKLNTNQSVSDYLTSVGQDPSIQNRQTLGQQHGISNIGTTEGNVSLLNALKGGIQPPQNNPVGGSVAEATTQDTNNGVSADLGVSGSIAGASSGTQTDTPPVLPEIATMKDTYVASQRAVLDTTKRIDDINKAIDSALQNKRDEIVRSGGVVNESQLRSLVLTENAPLLAERKDLLSQRSQLVGEQNIAGKSYQDALNAQKQSDANFYKEKQLNQGQQKIDVQQQQFAEKQALQQYQLAQKAITASQKVSNPSGANASTDDDIQAIVDGIVNGILPPTTIGFYSKSAAVKAGIVRSGFNLTKATEEWNAVSKYITSVNSTTQLRFRQAVMAVPEMLDNVSTLYDDMKSKLGSFGLKGLNKANLFAAEQGVYGSEAQSASTLLNQQINDITADIATIYRGGNTATDMALGKANQQLNGEWTETTFKNAIGLIRDNIQYRLNAVNNAGVQTPGGDNRYMPSNEVVNPSAPTKLKSNVQSILDNALKSKDLTQSGQILYLSRKVWDTLGSSKDDVLAEAETDGLKLLIK